MNNPVRTVALTSLALTGLGGALTWSSEGQHFATGVVATGLTMLGSLVMGAYAMKRVEGAAGASKKVLAVPFICFWKCGVRTSRPPHLLVPYRRLSYLLLRGITSDVSLLLA